HRAHARARGHARLPPRHDPLGVREPAMTSVAHDIPPVLRRSEEARPYWDGMQRGELLYQRCPDDGPVWFPRVACPRCLRTDPPWQRAAGTGRLFSYSVVHHAADPYWKARVPYGVGVAALDEGYYIFG